MIKWFVGSGWCHKAERLHMTPATPYASQRQALFCPGLGACVLWEARTIFLLLLSTRRISFRDNHPQLHTRKLPHSPIPSFGLKLYGLKGKEGEAREMREETGQQGEKGEEKISDFSF